LGFKDELARSIDGRLRLLRLGILPVFIDSDCLGISKPQPPEKVLAQQQPSKPVPASVLRESANETTS
jgi:hypothetical protein